MSKPSQLPTWATGANYSGGSESGTPTRVAPSGGEQTEGAEPGTRLAAQFFNWLVGFLCEWAGYTNARFDANGIPQTDGTQTVVLILYPGRIATPCSSDGLAIDWYGNSNGDALKSRVDNGQATVDLQGRVPQGATITLVRALLVTPGAARATSGDRVGFAVVTGAGATAFFRDDGTNGLQTITSGAISKTVDYTDGTGGYVKFEAGNDGGSHNTDAVDQLEVTFTYTKIKGY